MVAFAGSTGAASVATGAAGWQAVIIIDAIMMNDRTNRKRALNM
jgi:hypothetical protein